MTDDRFEDLLREAGREYHRPPATPREEMWQRIQAARSVRRRPRYNYQNAAWWVWGAGIAALFVLGIGLGRFSRGGLGGGDGAAPHDVAAADDRRAGDAAYRIATVEHLSQAETFLTLFRASVTRGGTGRGSEREVLAAASARQLLATNRLLLDSPAAEDERLRLLLEDLELVLAQISQLASRSRAEDLRLITNRIDRTAVMSRLRSEVPAGSGTGAGGGTL